MQNKANAYFLSQKLWHILPKLTNVIVYSASLLFCIKQEIYESKTTFRLEKNIDNRKEKNRSDLSLLKL